MVSFTKQTFVGKADFFENYKLHFSCQFRWWTYVAEMIQCQVLEFTK